MTTEVLSIVLTVALAALIVAAYLVARRVAKRPIWGEAAELAALFVDAAEQTLASAPGSEKLAWVMTQLGQRLTHVDTILLRTLVEAAVFRRKQGQEAAPDGGA